MNGTVKSLLKTLHLRRKKVLSTLDRNSISLADIYFIGADILYMRQKIFYIYLHEDKMSHNQFHLLDTWIYNFETYVFSRIQNDYSTYILDRL